MKILFITPETFDKEEGYTKEDLTFIGFPSLTAGVIGALTPLEIAEFKAIDEAIEPIRTSEDFDGFQTDIIALSVNMSYKANRAMKIASEFRRRRKIVVWGGVHVTALYDHHRERFEKEIEPYADAVVLGEAEEVWPQLIWDMYKNSPKKIYRAGDRPKSDSWPQPRYDLISSDKFLVKNSRQATRGCPLDCEFCSVTSFSGSAFRKRDAKIVANDIRETLSQRKQGFGRSFFAFVDDNICFDRGYFAELALHLIEVKKEFPKFCWGGQTNLYSIDKSARYKGAEYSLGDLMQRSGCLAMFVGIESVSKESLATANKNFNEVEKYPDQIKKFHDYGIMLNAGMVFGFDTDTENVFGDTYEFLVKNKVEISLLNILVPLPGTTLYKRYDAEGRLFDHNWENYDGRHVVYYPSLMTPEQLERGFFDLWKALYSWPSIVKRVVNPSQVIGAVKSLPNMSKINQIVSRVYMNKRYAEISSRIAKARRSSSKDRFAKNIAFSSSYRAD